MNEPIDSVCAAPSRLREPFPHKEKAASLAWAITAGEAILVGLMAVALVKYWLMLPVLVRLGAAVLLSVLALAGIYRLVKFHRRARSF
jgi:hypothetical protein